MYRIILCAGFFSFFDVAMQMFVSVKKGPEWWKDYAPYIYIVNMLLTFLGWPILIVTLVTVKMSMKFDLFFNSAYSGWAFTFSFLQVLWILEFIFVVRNG